MRDEWSGIGKQKKKLNDRDLQLKADKHKVQKI